MRERESEGKSVEEIEELNIQVFNAVFEHKFMALDFALTELDLG